MALTNYGSPHMPELIRSGKGEVAERTSYGITALDSSAHYMGSVVPMITGIDTTPAGTEFGIPAWTDDARVMGVVIGMHRLGSMVPIWEDDERAGTVTNATGELPVKYTFSATNDGSNASPDGELLDIMPILEGDIWEFSLFGASTASVNRGTTTPVGTTGSSGNIFVGLAVNATYPFSLLESSAAKALADTDFMTFMIDGKLPERLDRVYVLCKRSGWSLVVPQ